jgi:hypothetical protein
MTAAITATSRRAVPLPPPEEGGIITIGADIFTLLYQNI